MGGILGGRDFQINNASINVVGGDSHAHSHVHYHETKSEFKAILDAIDNHRMIQQDTLAKATPGTLEWLFKTEYFIAWWDKPGSFKVLWGSGIRQSTILFRVFGWFSETYVQRVLERRSFRKPDALSISHMYLITLQVHRH